MAYAPGKIYHPTISEMSYEEKIVYPSINDVHAPIEPEPPLILPTDLDKKISKIKQELSIKMERDAQLYRQIIMTYIENNVSMIQETLMINVKRGSQSACIIIRDFNPWYEMNRLFDLNLTQKEKQEILNRCLFKIRKLLNMNKITVGPLIKNSIVISF